MLTRKHERGSFEVIPAVDVLGDDAVRLERGRFDQVVARKANPEALVESFVEAGARLVHVVDLNGARTGRVDVDLVRRLATVASPARIQASGGVRSPRDGERLLEAGADRVVVGTGAFAAPRALEDYRDVLEGRLVVAIDVRAGRVVGGGWRWETVLTAAEAAEHCAAVGAPLVLCTAVDRDGTLEGPDLDLVARVRERSGLPILAAGGIRSQADLAALKHLGCESAIVGRALLEERLPLSILAARP